MFIPTFDNSISIHAPTRGATRLISEGHSGYIYFNPRSHKGSDRIRRDLAVGKKISIHAPTRGATHGGGQGCWAEAISIHAPTRGATAWIQKRSVPRRFQSQGERHSIPYRRCKVWQFQSTLPQGERRKAVFLCSVNCIFQSTLPQGERRIMAIMERYQWEFQSTLPQGERRKCRVLAH